MAEERVATLQSFLFWRSRTG
uniref:Bardet-Biedl syndrome 4 n=1 Tax=Homo sapiens TaxID=9606 RepID=H3BSL3_HUMAN